MVSRIKVARLEREFSVQQSASQQAIDGWRPIKKTPDASEAVPHSVCVP
jgi:hypothetical protein